MPVPRSLLLTLAALGAAAAAATEAETIAPTAALALDDECGVSEGGDGRCALNAMQLRRSADLGTSTSSDEEQDHPFISGCNDTVAGKECPLPLKCVTKPDGSWSQCVDCTTDETFQKDCIMMNEGMRDAAVEKCGRTCPFTTPRPLTSGCNDTDPELKCPGELKCVTQADGTWSQCVDCSKRFYKDCQQLKDSMRLAAVKVCKRTCVGTQCKGPEWCHHPYHCVGNKTWAQCIQCDSKTFHYACQHWKPSFREIAQSKCRRHCRR